MSNRNCPNCGAPYEIDSNKCFYCGTSYYDLSALDFTTREPFYLKIKTEINGAPCYITQLVRPSVNMSMEISTDTVDYYDGSGSIVRTCYAGNTLTTNISFEAVASPKYKNLCTIQIEED